MPVSSRPCSSSAPGREEQYDAATAAAADPRLTRRIPASGCSNRARLRRASLIQPTQEKITKQVQRVGPTRRFPVHLRASRARRAGQRRRTRRAQDARLRPRCPARAAFPQVTARPAHQVQTVPGQAARSETSFLSAGPSLYESRHRWPRHWPGPRPAEEHLAPAGTRFLPAASPPLASPSSPPCRGARTRSRTGAADRPRQRGSRSSTDCAPNGTRLTSAGSAGPSPRQS